MSNRDKENNSEQKQNNNKKNVGLKPNLRAQSHKLNITV